MTDEEKVVINEAISKAASAECKLFNEWEAKYGNVALWEATRSGDKDMVRLADAIKKAVKEVTTLMDVLGGTGEIK